MKLFSGFLGLALAQCTFLNPPSRTTQLTSEQVSMTSLAATVPDDVFDYVVVGSGPGGIVTADKLSASGKNVLLIERGPPSSFRWGGSESIKIAGLTAAPSSNSFV